MKNSNNLSADKAGKTKNINMEIINNLLKKFHCQFNLPIPTFQQIGNKIYHLIVVALLTFGFQSFAQYVPPIGIPAPEFGIDESHTMYTNAQYDFGNGLEPYKDAGNGPYTHYVDNTVANCTNSNNPYGTSALPRCSLPKSPGIYEAGSVVEIHGGTYNYNGWQNIISNGTPSNPVFIRGINTGANRVRYIGTQLRIAGEYMIIENLEMYNDNARIHFSPSWDSQGRSNHISFRNSEVHKPPTETGNNSGVIIFGDDIVIYNNSIHHNVKSATLDANGVVVATGSNRVWILENDIHNNSGNGIAACHNCDPAPRFIYIGKNTIHDDRELAIGLKYAEDVIISQNKIWGYNGATTAQATGIVVGADGATIRVWMIFNEIYDSLNGIRIEETPTDVWIIGNIIYDITEVGINLEKNAQDVYVLNNTFNNIGTGINQTWREFFTLKAFNNIFSDIGTYPINITRTAVSNSSEASNNLFSQNGSSFPIRWEPSNTSYTTTLDLDSFPGGNNNIVANPDFVSSLFDIGINSGAINTGNATGDAVFAYTQFEDLYGINIRVDYNGVARPQNSPWDIGAYEYGSTLSNNDETLDTTISITPNPTNDTLTIGVKDDIVKKVIIYNELGQQIKEATTKEVNISNLSNGIYFVKIVLQSGKETAKKIIKN